MLTSIVGAFIRRQSGPVVLGSVALVCCSAVVIAAMLIYGPKKRLVITFEPVETNRITKSDRLPRLYQPPFDSDQYFPPPGVIGMPMFVPGIKFLPSQTRVAAPAKRRSPVSRDRYYIYVEVKLNTANGYVGKVSTRKCRPNIDWPEICYRPLKERKSTYVLRMHQGPF